MSITLRSPRNEALREFLVQKRKASGVTQAELVKRIGRGQSFVADVERGERRVDLIQFLILLTRLILMQAKRSRRSQVSSR